MTDTTELQRLTRLRRLARQIAVSLPADLVDEDRGRWCWTSVSSVNTASQQYEEQWRTGELRATRC